MDFNEFFKKENAQKQIDRLAKKYKGKKIAIYGAGQYCRLLFDTYDLSKLNIVAIADKKFEDIEARDFYGLNCIAPDELRELDCNVILLGTYDAFYFTDYLEDELLVGSKNSKIKVKPLVKQSFFRFIKSLFSDEE